MKKFLFLFVLLLTATLLNETMADNEQLAFPGADGYAKHVTGGRGGKVYYVTSLADCTDDNLVPGTLRWALRTGDDTPRTILFAVSGTIYLDSKLKTNHANVSILGQSAPGGGICITGYPVVVNNRNYIIRFVRFRAGDIPALVTRGNESFSGLDVENAAEVILDHCSVTWSMEECLTMFDNDTTTVQYCIIGEGLYHSYNAKTTGDDSGRAFAMQWGGDHSNMHHTLITNCNGRAPRFNGVREANAWLAGANGKQYAHDCHIDGDFANNVFYNWGGSSLSYYGGEFYASYFADAPEGLDAYNRIYMRNNYFRPGPSTKVNGASYRHFFHPSGDADNQIGQWYLSGNKFELSSYYTPSGTYWTDAELQKVNDDNMAGFGTSATALDLSSTYQSHVMTAIPYELSGYEPESADEAYAKVVSQSQGAGACLPRYDEEDQRLVDEAAGRRDGQTPFQGSRATGAAKRPGIIDTQSDITFLNGNDTVVVAGTVYTCYPTLALNSDDRYAIDSDADGMPDAYEEQNGLDKNDASDGAALAANGYTNLENYLNGLADFSLSNSDYQTSATYVEPGLAVRPSEVTLTFACDNSDVEGSLPAPIMLGYGDAITFEHPHNLYREGYSLQGWSDGSMTYQFGTEYAGYFLQDVTLRPAFTANSVSIDDRTEDVTVVWDFTAASAPSIAKGSKGIYTTSATVDGKQLDVRLSYDGLSLALPACADAVATITFTTGVTQDFAAVADEMTLTLTSANVKSVSLTLPYTVDLSGCEFHSVSVGTGTNYELVYADTLTIDALSWMNTNGQRRHGSRNCIDPTGDDATQYTESSTTGCKVMSSFLVGGSGSNAYTLTAYIKDCARVRTYASGSNSAGDQMVLTALPADGSDKLQAYNLHKLSKSASFSEYFDLDLDPDMSYMLTWSSMNGNDMMVGAIKFYDQTGKGSTSGDATIIWDFAGSVSTEANTVDPTKAFASTQCTIGSAFTTSQGEISDGVYAVDFRQTSEASAKQADHLIEFTVTPKAGFEFTPTTITLNRAFQSNGSGTKGQFDVFLQYGTEAEDSLCTLRSTSSATALTIRNTVAAFQDKFHATTKPFRVRLYVHDIPSQYYLRLYDIRILGTYAETSTQKHTFATAVSPAASGVITQSPKGTSFVAETQITVNAYAVSGYMFDHWANSAGEVVSADASFVYTMPDSDEVLTAHFKDLSDSKVFLDGPFNAMVSNADELAEALSAAAQSTAERYYIFLRNGEYDFGTTAKTAVPQNTSLIGESQEGVLVFNTPSATVTDYQNETPVLFIDQNQNNVYMQDLTVRQARDWAAKTSQGQALAIRQRGKQAIYKNVTLQGVQDTYYLNKADGTAYFEDCTVAGEVDFIYGDGTMFFQNCQLNPVSSNAYITAPNTQPGYMGIVFNECTISKPADAKDAVTGYKLGRPWGDSPAATFINTTMNVLPADAGWGSMTTGCVLRFHEYGSMDANGTALDLSARSLSACSPADGSDNPVLTAAEAAAYSLDKVFTSWSPADLTAQLQAPALKAEAGMLTWDAVDGAYCYAIVLDGSVIGFTTGTSYACTEAGSYAIRVANAMGGLGTASNAVASDAAGLSEFCASTPAATPSFDLNGRRSASASGLFIQSGKVIFRK